jgi:hypothetical protein
MTQTRRIRVSDRSGPALCRAFTGMRAADDLRTLPQRVEQIGLADTLRPRTR